MGRGGWRDEATDAVTAARDRRRGRCSSRAPAPATGRASGRGSAGGVNFPEQTYLLTLPTKVRLAAGRRQSFARTASPSISPGSRPRTLPKSKQFGVVLAIDASTSMRGEPIANAMDAARAFARRTDAVPAARRSPSTTTPRCCSRSRRPARESAPRSRRRRRSRTARAMYDGVDRGDPSARSGRGIASGRSSCSPTGGARQQGDARRRGRARAEVRRPRLRRRARLALLRLAPASDTRRVDGRLVHQAASPDELERHLRPARIPARERVPRSLPVARRAGRQGERQVRVTGFDGVAAAGYRTPKLPIPTRPWQAPSTARRYATSGSRPLMILGSRSWSRRSSLPRAGDRAAALEATCSRAHVGVRLRSRPAQERCSRPR